MCYFIYNRSSFFRFTNWYVKAITPHKYGSTAANSQGSAATGNDVRVLLQKLKLFSVGSNNWLPATKPLSLGAGRDKVVGW